MKNVVLFSIILLGFISCSKKEDVKKTETTTAQTAQQKAAQDSAEKAGSGIRITIDTTMQDSVIILK